MGQSMASTGGGKQKGASGQRQDQPEREPGQKMRDRDERPAQRVSRSGGPAKAKNAASLGERRAGQSKPEGGADHGARSVR